MSDVEMVMAEEGVIKESMQMRHGKFRDGLDVMSLELKQKSEEKNA